MIIFSKINDSEHNDLNQLTNYVITSALFHPRFLIFGSETGEVFIFDHIGNLFSDYKTSSSIKQLDMDSVGDNLAVSNQKNMIRVIGLFSQNECIFELEATPCAISLPGDYFDRSIKCIVVCYNRRIYLVEKKMFGLHKTLLYANEQDAKVLKWQNRFLAWASSQGVCIFDMEARQLVGYINFKDSFYDPVSTFVDILWGEENTLYVAIGNRVQVLFVRKNDARLIMTFYSVVLLYEIKLEYQLETFCLMLDKIICISKSISDSSQIIITIDVYSNKDKTVEIVGSQTITIPSCPDDTNILSTSLYGESYSFLFVGRQMYSLRLQNSEDLIQNLIKESNYKEAYKHALNTKDSTLINIITVDYIHHCLQSNNNELPIVLNNLNKITDAKTWQLIIERFIEFDKIEMIINIIPVLSISGDQIDISLFNRILGCLLIRNCKMFSECILKWPNSYYNTAHILDLISKSFISTDDVNLLTAKAILLCHNHQNSMALTIYIQLKDRKAFELIQQHQLFNEALTYLDSLIEIDMQETLKIIINQKNDFPINIVTEKLKYNKLALFNYLNRLYIENPSYTKDYMDTQIELSIKFSSDSLLLVLRNSADYNIKNAIELCRSHMLYNEYAYLCEKNGDLESALDTYLYKSHDIQKAVSLCNRIQDSSFWESLISFCTSHPQYICILLTNSQPPIDASELIRRIPNETPINNLCSTISKLFYDVNTNLALMQSCTKILKSDNIKSLVLSHKSLKHGSTVNVVTKCCICHETLVIERQIHIQDAVIFLCGHTFHSVCISNKIGRDDICMHCNADLTLIPDKLYKIKLH